MQTFSFQREVHANALKKGFWGQPNVTVALALVHCEVSEAIEELRKGGIDKEKFGEELADIVIRTLDIAEYMKIDLGKAVETKHRKNLLRPYKHGKNF